MSVKTNACCNCFKNTTNFFLKEKLYFKQKRRSLFGTPLLKVPGALKNLSKKTFLKLFDEQHFAIDRQWPHFISGDLFQLISCITNSLHGRKNIITHVICFAVHFISA